jgi:hypothetical protein
VLKNKVNKMFASLKIKMSEEFSLKDKVFRTFLQNPNLGPDEMSVKLCAKYNSVKDAFARLAKDDLLLRSGRGNYELNYPGILLNIIERLDALEKDEAKEHA